MAGLVYTPRKDIGGREEAFGPCACGTSISARREFQRCVVVVLADRELGRDWQDGNGCLTVRVIPWNYPFAPKFWVARERENLLCPMAQRSRVR